jgi:hypothetical protein
MSPENHEMAHGPTIGTAPTSNESNKNVATWFVINRTGDATIIPKTTFF